MKIITLKRICMTDVGTFGVMIEEGNPPAPFCLTIELPWKDNKPEISCIPEGEYYCKIVQSPKFGRVFEITGVPNRNNILIHKGNWTTDTLGCVILGEQFEDTLNPAASRVVTSVVSSGAALDEFMGVRLHGQSDFTLVVKKA